MHKDNAIKEATRKSIEFDGTYYVVVGGYYGEETIYEVLEDSEDDIFEEYDPQDVVCRVNKGVVEFLY